MSREHTYKELEQRIKELEKESAERKLAEEALSKSKELVSTVIDAIPSDICILDETGTIITVNQAWRDFAIANPPLPRNCLEGADYLAVCDTAIGPDAGDAKAFAAGIRAVMSGEREEFSLEYPCHSSTRQRWFIGRVTRFFEEGSTRIVVAHEEITEHKKTERRQHLVADILGILNDPLNLPDAINRILTAITRETGFDAVGIRLRSGDDFPYFVQTGFSKDFLVAENWLAAHDKDGSLCRDKNGSISLECTCGLVISGQTDPTNPLFTPGGSFWTNDTLPLLGLPAGQDPRLYPRNRCIHEGFRSVALVPIRANRELVGLLQLNDRETGRFTLDMIQFFEGISASIGVALIRKRNEEDLRESEERFRILAETVEEVFWMADNEMNNIFYMSPGYEQVWDRSRQNLYDNPKSFREAIHPEDRERVVLSDLGVKRTGQPFDHEYRIIRLDGGIRWIWERGFPVRSETGQVTRYVGIANDITDRRLAEEALQTERDRAQKYLDIAGVILVGLALDQTITLINKKGCELLGYAQEELMGRNYFDMVLPERERDKVKAVFSRLMGGELEPIEYVENYVVTRNGQERVVIFHNALVRDAAGEIAGTLSSGEDITERKRAEEALRESEQRYRSLHSLLEVRVRERTAELERKNLELQEFAFVASHDLAEPLRKIQTFGSLLELKGADHLSEVEKDYIHRMTVAANRMQELLEALLRYSRIEAKGEDFKPTRLNDVVQEVSVDLEIEVLNVGAHVEIGPLPIVMGDWNQLRQLFQNLISNSLKYARSEVKPLIRVYGEEKNGECRIFVEDNGIGFDEKYLEKIFQPFQRLHGRNEYPGTGIGLAICRKIAERHGGTITATSTPGKGATFIVTLPLDGTKAME